jgi:acetaldehyde dehydrogenase/alcohol dehydrogenase
LDIRKRVVKFPTPKKVQLICIPTTSGTGSEVTPFAIITDEKTHIKYSLADYALIPTIAIVDAQFMMSLPPRMTAVTAADALSHCFESYVSVLATEFTRPYSLEGIKLIFKYLKRAYDHGTTDKEAREAIAHAATIAGIAFGNAYLGIVHSLSHKIGGHFGVMHGAANGIYLPYVMRYNAAKFEREKQMY